MEDIFFGDKLFKSDFLPILFTKQTVRFFSLFEEQFFCKKYFSHFGCETRLKTIFLEINYLKFVESGKGVAALLVFHLDT